MFRIVIHFATQRQRMEQQGRILALAGAGADVSRGGHLLQVLTQRPEDFIAAYFEAGFINTFTCQLEGI